MTSRMKRHNAESRRIAKSERDREAYAARQREKAHRAAVGRQTAAELAALIEERTRLASEERRIRLAEEDRAFAARMAELRARQASVVPVDQTATGAPVVEVLPKRRAVGGMAFLLMAGLLGSVAGGEK